MLGAILVVWYSLQSQEEDIQEEDNPEDQGIYVTKEKKFTNNTISKTECEENQTRLCENQLGICYGFNETCIENNWSGCDYSLVENYNETEICDDGLDNNCDGFLDANDSDCGLQLKRMTLEGNGFFNMKIESIVSLPNSIEINTTGARYLLKDKEIEMWRRIDPNSNSLNPKEVAKLNFESSNGDFVIRELDSKKAVIESDIAKYIFYADSFFVIESKTLFSYTHKSLISNAEWSKTGRSKLDRIWTDGSGGSLHAYYEGTQPTASSQSSSTVFNMAAGNKMAHMVFPSREFNFEALYGDDARPFVIIRYGHSDLQEDMIDFSGAKNLEERGVGVILLWNLFYEKVCIDGLDPRCWRGSKPEFPEQTFPMYLNPVSKTWVPEENLFGYDYAEPEFIKSYVAAAHQHGFKAITYMAATQYDPDLQPTPLSDPKCKVVNPSWKCYARVDKQSINKTLIFMQAFQDEYDLDGWYFDNAGINYDHLNDNYNFIKSVREQVGDDGIIFHHDSVDIWDAWLNYAGLRAIMIDNYADYTITGETGEIAKIHDPYSLYLRYYASGYGMSQALGMVVKKSDGTAAIQQKELGRVMASNLNSINLYYKSGNFLVYFKQNYDLRKQQYLSGSFNPNVDWPIDGQDGWFRRPTDIQLTKNSPTSFNLSWMTNEAATSEVLWANESGKWWPPEGNTSELDTNPMVTAHSVTLNNLRENVPYKFKIRSSNKESTTSEIIWGDIVSG
jgi:hypothetical protein